MRAATAKHTSKNGEQAIKTKITGPMADCNFFVFGGGQEQLNE